MTSESVCEKLGGHNDDDDGGGGGCIVLAGAASFYLSGCKKSQQTANQTGGVVRLLGEKQNNRLTGTGLTGDWLVANSV